MSAAVRLSLFYAAFFLGVGVAQPFWPVWLAGRGLGAAEIGLLFALGQWLKIGINPLLGWMADRARDWRRFMVGLAVVMLAGYLLCVPAYGFTALLVPWLLITIGGTALPSLGDVPALAADRAGELQYGRVRLWGTIAFIVATLASGVVLAGRSRELVLALMIGTTVLIVGACALVPSPGAPPQARALTPWRSLASPSNLLVLAAATCVQSSHAVYYAFGSLYWQRIGLGDGAIAALWAEGAIAEVLLFYAGGRVVRAAGPIGLLAIGGVGGVVRWSLTASVTSLPALVLLQPLHAATFAAAHLGAMQYISGAVPRDRAGTSQSIYTGMVGGLGLGIATAMSGALYAAWSGEAYLAMAVLAGLGAVAALTCRLYRPRDSRSRAA